MEIRTTRLLIREPRESDLAEISAFYTDPVVQRYARATPGEAETRALLLHAIQAGAVIPRVTYKLVIADPQSDLAIGIISLKVTFANIREYEIGWMVRRADWGKGYAPEAARALLYFAFRELGAHRVMSFCHAANCQSTRVMEKIGMQREGRLRQTGLLDGWHDEYIYGILENEYLQNETL